MCSAVVMLKWRACVLHGCGVRSMTGLCTPCLFSGADRPGPSSKEGVSKALREYCFSVLVVRRMLQSSSHKHHRP
jgi:hypothetical protein